MENWCNVRNMSPHKEEFSGTCPPFMSLSGKEEIIIREGRLD